MTQLSVGWLPVDRYVAVDAVQQTIIDVSSRIESVLASLGDREPAASMFFLEVQRVLVGARDEADLIDVFIALSTTAFHGFEFPTDSLEPIDLLLADAERIAFTFTADGAAH